MLCPMIHPGSGLHGKQANLKTQQFTICLTVCHYVDSVISAHVKRKTLFANFDLYSVHRVILVIINIHFTRSHSDSTQNFSRSTILILRTGTIVHFQTTSIFPNRKKGTSSKFFLFTQAWQVWYVMQSPQPFLSLTL